MEHKLFYIFICLLIIRITELVLEKKNARVSAPKLTLKTKERPTF